MFVPAMILKSLSLMVPFTILQPNCPKISHPGQKVGKVTDPQIDEASDLLVSQSNPDILWTLNDSGGVSCLFAMAINGSLVHKLCLHGAENYDWEAMATAPCKNRQVIFNIC
jgi:hypothetical protein